MTAREKILEAFGLPDVSTFEIEVDSNFSSHPIKITPEGHRSEHFSVGGATKLADAIRSNDTALAEQIDACIKTARRYSKSSD